MTFRSYDACRSQLTNASDHAAVNAKKAVANIKRAKIVAEALAILTERIQRSLQPVISTQHNQNGWHI